MGRQKESGRILHELRAGRNLVLSGAYGIGRTALLRHLASEWNEGWRFIFLDGSQTAALLCDQLILNLIPPKAGSAGPSHIPWTVRRRELEEWRARDRRTPVIVLDDLAKVSPAKLDFLRWLNALGHFRIIAVAESFLPEGSLMRLRTALLPAPLVVLERLGPAPAHQFFEGWARHHGLTWGKNIIHGLASATHGYPLGMLEAARAAMGRDPGRPGQGSCGNVTESPSPAPARAETTRREGNR